MYRGGHSLEVLSKETVMYEVKMAHILEELMIKLTYERKIIDLGMHPYADTFISKDQLNLSEPVFPLECYLNKKNFEIKLGVKTNPDDRYNLYDYSYTSSNSSFSRNYWSSYCKDIINSRLINYESSILEIGSNDGYLLSLFKKRGFKKVTGYDSSKKMVDVAKSLISNHTWAI